MNAIRKDIPITDFFVVYMYYELIKHEENIEKMGECSKFFNDFRRNGLDNPDSILIDYARKNDLFISGGSDFHGDKKPNNEIGKGSGSLKIPKEYIEEWVNL